MAQLEPGKGVEWPTVLATSVDLVGTAVAGVDVRVGRITSAKLDAYIASGPRFAPPPADFAPVDRRAGSVGKLSLDLPGIIEEFEQLAVAPSARRGGADIDDLGGKGGVAGEALAEESDLCRFLVIKIRIE